jgi:hypothetical protein
MQVWTQQAHECLMNQLQYRNQVRVQDTLQMEHFFSVWNCSPAPEKEKERESRNLYGIMEK